MFPSLSGKLKQKREANTLKWGIIGTGNMGKVLIHAFLQSKLLDQRDLFVTNRTVEQAYELKETYPHIQVKDDPFTLIDSVDTVFICVKPVDMVPLLKEISHRLNQHHLLVSITSPVSVQEIESLVDCQVARMIPSITNQALAGVSLLTFSEKIDHDRKQLFIKRCRSFSEPLEIKEDIVRISSDIVSCGPAFFAFLAQSFIENANELTEITKEDATLLMEKMFIGFGKLLATEQFTLPELIEKVCVKGGITGVGIAAIEAHTDNPFHHLIKGTHEKFHTEKAHIQSSIHYS